MTRTGAVHIAVVLFAGGLAGTAIAAEDRPDAVPYRPTVSTPATLSAPGWIEIEAGGLSTRDRRADDGAGHRASVPYAVEYAFTDDWGIRLAGDALVHAVDGAGASTGFGDTALIGKRRFAIDTASALGLEAGTTFPTGRRALHSGSGKPDYSATGIYSDDVGDWHGDVNVGATRLGARDASGSRLQTLGALAASRRLDDRWTAEAEISGMHQRHVPGTAQLLGAVSYALRRDVVLDLGTAHGLNRASPTWQAFAGVTFVAGRID